MYNSALSLTWAVDVCAWSTPRSCPFTPGKDPVPIVQEAGWVPGPVWTGAENLAPIGIRSPDRPARSTSLYRLRCRGSWEMGAKIISEENTASSSILPQNETRCSFGTLVHVHQIVRCHAGDKPRWRSSYGD